MKIPIKGAASRLAPTQPTQPPASRTIRDRLASPSADELEREQVARRLAIIEESKKIAIRNDPQNALTASENDPDMQAIYALIVNGDLSRLSQPQRVMYYKEVCTSVGLNPMTQPFEFVKLNGKLVLYAKKEAATQLAQKHEVSVEIISQALDKDMSIYEVWTRASTSRGRVMDDMGAVPLSAAVKGEAAANAKMKAITKAKRRAILSICGLGMLDESELETIRGAQVVPVYEEPQEDPEPVKPEPAPSYEKKTKPAETKKEEIIHEEEEAEAVESVPEAVPDDGDFRYEDKETRQRLIREIKSRFPKIDKAGLIQIAETYRAAGAWKVVLTNLDDILSFEQSKGDSKLL